MMHKSLGMFALGLISGVILMFGLHNGMIKRERTFGTLVETIQQTLEARLLQQGETDTLQAVIDKNLQQRGRLVIERNYPSRDRVLAFLGVYYEFTGRTIPEDLREPISASTIAVTPAQIDEHLAEIKKTLE